MKSLYVKNQAPKPNTLARTISFISPYLGLYKGKRKVFKGGGCRGEFGFGILKYSPKLDPMPNLRPISQMVWPEHSALIFQFFDNLRVEVETPPPHLGGASKFFILESNNIANYKTVCQNQAPKPKTLAKTISFIFHI